MTILSLVTAMILAILALFHGLWGARLWWPFGNEPSLARAVTGFRGVTSMPNAASCWIVALALSVACVIALDLGALEIIPVRDVTTIAASGLIAVFALRGVLGYTPQWRKRTPEQPFRRLDSVLYSPLCLAIAGSFAALLWGHLTS